jgi:hypothetical protein
VSQREGKRKPAGQLKPVAAKVDKDLWDEVKIQAIREGRKIGDVLGDALRYYLETQSRRQRVD